MHQDHIKLQEAMTMDISKSVRIWEIVGLHVTDNDIPKNAKVLKTFVMKSRGGKIRLGIEWVAEAEEDSPRMNNIAEFSALEELKEKFPNLFELEGSLIAYS